MRADFARDAHWSALKGAGQSRVLKTSWFWLVFVPPIAHLLQSVPETVQVPWLGNLPLHPHLPFSWRWFYYSAICVAVADAVFFLRCPSIVKDHNSDSDFMAAGKTSNHLDDYLAQFDRGHRLARQFTPRAPTPSFWTVHEQANKAHPVSRLLCLALYAAGLVCFLVVAWRNFEFVVLR